MRAVHHISVPDVQKIAQAHEWKGKVEPGMGRAMGIALASDPPVGSVLFPVVARGAARKAIRKQHFQFVRQQFLFFLIIPEN